MVRRILEGKGDLFLVAYDDTTGPAARNLREHHAVGTSVDWPTVDGFNNIAGAQTCFKRIA